MKAGQAFNIVDKTGEWYAVTGKVSTGEMKSGWVRASDGIVKYTTLTEPLASLGELAAEELSKIHSALTTKCTELYKKYKDNDYLSVTGFSLKISAVPAADVHFEFK